MCRLLRTVFAVILSILLANPLSANEYNSSTEVANITKHQKLYVRSKGKTFEQTTVTTDAKRIDLSDEPPVIIYDSGNFFETTLIPLETAITTEEQPPGIPKFYYRSGVVSKKLAKKGDKNETSSTTKKPRKLTTTPITKKPRKLSKKSRKSPTKPTRKTTTTTKATKTTKAPRTKPVRKAKKTRKPPTTEPTTKATEPSTTKAPTQGGKKGKKAKTKDPELADAAEIISKAAPIIQTIKPAEKEAEKGKMETLTMDEAPKKLEKSVEVEVMQIKVDIKAMAKELAELKAELHHAVKLMDVTGLTVQQYPVPSVTVQLESGHGIPEKPKLFQAPPPQTIPGMEVRNCSMTPEDRIAIVNKHNEFRLRIAQGMVPNQPKGINLKRMVWDDDLERASEYVARIGRFAHITLRDARFYYGQNLHKHDSTQYSDPNWMRGLESWFSEHEGYVYGPSLAGDPKGHYTQLVWAFSQYVGCSLCHIHNNLDPTFHEMNFYVCHYGPSGNYIGALPYEVGLSGCENLC